MNGDKDDDFFRNGFPFFGKSGRNLSLEEMFREVEEMNRQMQELFKFDKTGFPPFNNEGNSPPMNIPGGFPPVNIPGDSPPLNPRAQMLKNDDEDDNKKKIKDSKNSPGSGSQGQTFSDRVPTDDRLSPISEGKPFFMRRMKGVHVVRHSDGSVEQTETVDQDGMICKTVTITDPNGKSTTTTSCDKSDGPRNLMQQSPFMMFPRPGMNEGFPNADVPKIEAPSVNTGLNKEDASFFSKLFGGFWNKPKS